MIYYIKILIQSNDVIVEIYMHLKCEDAEKFTRNQAIVKILHFRCLMPFFLFLQKI
jgi:hypothetical protein